MKKIKKISKVCFLLVCIISLVCIPFATSASAASYEPAKAPKINFFTASPTTVSVGGTTTLKWDVSNATKIDIKGIRTDEGQLPLSGSIEVWPEATTTYVLTAYGNGGESSSSLTVNVGTVSKAKVDSFSTSATEVVKGNSIWLNWKTSNAKLVKITGLKVDEGLDLNGSLEVWPEESTTYLIQAYGANGDVDSKSVTVNVIEPVLDPSINSFSAANSEITSGESTKLSWSVSNAKSIAIKNVQSGLAANGSLVVAPTYTTTYTLEAIGANGKVVTKSVTVTVKPVQNKPVINSFTADEIKVSKGSLVTLSWNTSNAAGCMILTSDGSKLTNRPTSGKISVTPYATKTYTLVAYNADKSISVEKSITITVY